MILFLNIELILDARESSESCHLIERVPRTKASNLMLFHVHDNEQFLAQIELLGCESATINISYRGNALKCTTLLSIVLNYSRFSL
jgi:hypothetical protein